MQNDTIIYWIRLKSHSDFTSQGYIGVTKRGSRRLTDHLTALDAGVHKNTHLSHAYKKYGADQFVYEVLLVGDEEYCYQVESQWRPTSNLGWNIAPGGHRGPGWPIGRKRDPETIKKVAATKAANKEFRDAKKAATHAALKAAKEKAKEEKIATKQQELLLQKAAKEKAKEEKIATKQQELLLQKAAKEKAKEENSYRKLCPLCQKKPVAINYVKENKTYFRKSCDNCSGPGSKKIKPHAWVKSGYKKKPHCEKCGFVAKLSDQLQVFHVDGNLKNTNWANLKTVCANCAIEVYRSALSWKPSQPEL